MNSKTWVIIPARYGSTRLQAKPLLELAGNPLFAHVFDRAVEAGVDPARVVLATDDVRISQRAGDFGIHAVMTSREHGSGSDRVLEATSIIGVGNDDIVVNLQADEPFVPAELVSSLIRHAKSCNFGISTVVVPLACRDDFLDPNVVKVVLGDAGRALYFSRAGIPYARDRESAFGLAYRHIGVYCYEMSSLKRFCSLSPPALEQSEKLEQLRALHYGLPIGCVVFDGAVPHGVDTLADYQRLIEKYGP